jgi:hypothetical protein
MNDGLPFDHGETTTAFLERICHLRKQTLVEPNVRSAFMQLGLSYDTEVSSYLLELDGNGVR